MPILSASGTAENWVLRYIPPYSSDIQGAQQHAKFKAIPFCANQLSLLIEAIILHPCQQAAAPHTTNCPPSFPARSHFCPIFKRTSLLTQQPPTNLSSSNLHNTRSLVATLRLEFVTLSKPKSPAFRAVVHFSRKSPTFRYSLEPLTARKSRSPYAHIARMHSDNKCDRTEATSTKIGIPRNPSGRLDNPPGLCELQTEFQARALR